ncbi:AraC family transcriptional regulator [Mesorhizobium sp. IMUNJ 23232]|uniref:AraC family transcriptional regulator n=1 Tax=Mesorhizobium sp. IMUNJ 23232 TaxID=3376064 RepID=UPI0037AC26F4
MQTAAAAAPVNRFSIADWPEKDRLGMLHDVYTGALLECDIAPADGELAEFTASSRPLPGLDILSVASSGLRVRRSKTQVDPEHIYLNINLAGSRHVSQQGREAVSAEGEAMFIAGGAGVDMTIAPGARFMTLKMEIAAIEPLVPDYGDRLIQPIPSKSEALQLLSGYLGTLDKTEMLATPNLQRVVATHVHDLAALTLGAARDGADQARERGARAARLQAIKADVAANLDGDVSVDAVARRHRVTPRSVQMALEVEGVTFTDFVLGQRLARAHRMLSDPLRVGQKISTIALDAGFGDLSYFNRVFRRRFGVAPSEVRAVASLSSKPLEPDH